MDSEVLSCLCRNLCRHDQTAAGAPKSTASTVTACSSTTPGGALLTSCPCVCSHAALNLNLHGLLLIVCSGQVSAFHHAEPCRHHQAYCSEPLVLRCCSVPCRHQHHQPRCPLQSPQSPASSVCSSHSRSCSCQSRLLHVPSSRHSTSPCTQLALGPAPVLVRPQSQRQTSCQGAFTR